MKEEAAQLIKCYLPSKLTSKIEQNCPEMTILYGTCQIKNYVETKYSKRRIIYEIIIKQFGKKPSSSIKNAQNFIGILADKKQSYMHQFLKEDVNNAFNLLIQFDNENKTLDCQLFRNKQKIDTTKSIIFFYEESPNIIESILESPKKSKSSIDDQLKA